MIPQVIYRKDSSSGGDDQNAISVSPWGSIYICSDFAFADTFIVGIDTLFQTGYPEDVFVAKLSYHSTVNISEINHSSNFILYPNPFTNEITFEAKTNEQIELLIYDIMGRNLLQKKFTNSVSLNTEQLAKGLYLYEVRNKDGSCKKGKVVKD